MKCATYVDIKDIDRLRGQYDNCSNTINSSIHIAHQ